MAQTFFAVTIPGLETQLQAELRALGAKKCTIEHGGVVFRSTRAKSYAILQNVRQANRLYLRLDEFRARDIHELYRKTKRMAWPEWLKNRSTIAVNASMSKSNFGGTGQIARSVESAIVDAMEDGKKSVEINDKSMRSFRIMVRVEETRCQISLDLAGRSLYQRDWRVAVGDAPMRETTASSLLAAIGWTPQEVLMDPMCGAGTFLIEAALTAANRSPRIWNTYATEHLANFDDEQWPLPSPVPAENPALLYGRDQNARMLDHAIKNTSAASVDGAIQWDIGDVETMSAPHKTGVIVCNPPFGMRIDRASGAQAPEQRLMARFARPEFAAWRMGMLVPSDFTLNHDALEIEELLRFKHGGLPVRFWKLTHKS